MAKNVEPFIELRFKFLFLFIEFRQFNVDKLEFIEENPAVLVLQFDVVNHFIVVAVVEFKV